MTREKMLEECVIPNEEAFAMCDEHYQQGRIDIIKELNAKGYLFDTDEYGETVGRNDEFWIKLIEE